MAASHIYITEYVYGGAGDELQGTENVGVPVEGAFFSEVSSDDPKSDDGVNAKITYRNDPTGKVIYTSDTADELVAKANGTVSAS